MNVNVQNENQSEKKEYTKKITGLMLFVYIYNNKFMVRSINRNDNI